MGICVGMQLLADEGVEHGTTRGLAGFAALCARFMPAADLKIPHMGWNDVVPTEGRPLIENGEAYFLHGYHSMRRMRRMLWQSRPCGALVAAVGVTI